MISLFFTIALFIEATSCCHKDKLIHTLSGPVQGFLKYVNEDPVKVFLGIPFAEPPIGNLRFLKPKPVKTWIETLEATRMPPACMQYTEYAFPWYDSLPKKSEDCLYLNIYTPVDAKNGSDLAVLFWIHGGGFTFGSNRMDVYDASALAVRGNVIVVTINYRLGLFGFLTSNTEEAPGNAGMYDIVMALQWVNDNIESFGGDKKRITLQGESAGSIITSLLCVSPLTKGLFSKAILQSATALLLKFVQMDHNLVLSQRLAEAVGCESENQTIENEPGSVIGCLRDKEATHLARVLWSFNPTSTRSFFPQYGDDLLPRNAVDDIRNGNFYNIPLLIGNNRDEGSFQITTNHVELFGFFGDKNPIINKTHAEAMIRKIFRNFNNPEKYVQHYLGSIPDDDYDAMKRQVYTASGDSSLLCETVYFAESYADKKNDVYFYLFSHRPSNSVWSPWMGVVHADEIQFVFGQPVRNPQLYEPSEVELSEKLIEIWANFAKSGTPCTSFNWPKYSRGNPTFVRIDKDFSGSDYGTGPHLENCKVMRDDFGF